MTIVSRRVRGRPSCTQKNLRVRESARKHNVALWQVAERYGLSEAKFSVMLRHELPEDNQAELVTLIDEIAAERDGSNAGG